MFHYALINGVLAAQTPRVFEVFSKIIKDFDLIIEIGTYKGAFSTWVYENKKQDCNFITYDINPDEIQIPEEYKKLIDIRIANCFSEEEKLKIKNLIASSGKTLFLCDGGNKIEEFRIYSELLKKGDVIMLHDYADDPISFINIANKNSWPAKAESSFAEINDHVVKNKLEKFMYESFIDVFWGAFIKE